MKATTLISSRSTPRDVSENHLQEGNEHHGSGHENGGVHVIPLQNPKLCGNFDD
jgi:hypothetical protein